MSNQTAHEQRVRRLAHREGYRLQKLRNDNGYWLSDVNTNFLMIGECPARGYYIGYDLDVIEDWLNHEH